MPTLALTFQPDLSLLNFRTSKKEGPSILMVYDSVGYFFLMLREELSQKMDLELTNEDIKTGMNSAFLLFLYRNNKVEIYAANKNFNLNSLYNNTMEEILCDANVSSLTSRKATYKDEPANQRSEPKGIDADIFKSAILGSNIHSIEQVKLYPRSSIDDAPLNNQYKQVIKNASQWVGALCYVVRDPSTGNIIEYVKAGSAIQINLNLVITTRHEVNRFFLEELCVVFKNAQGVYEPYFFQCVVEDGAYIGQDYIILGLKKLLPNSGVNIVKDQNSLSGARAWVGLDENDIPLFSTWSENPGRLHEIAHTSYVPTSEKSSGGGYFDAATGQLYALHVKRVKEGMFAEQRTAVLLQTVIDSGQSILKNLDPNCWIDLSAYPKFSQEFPFFSTSFADLYEIDESLRNDFLGATPQLSEIVRTRADKNPKPTAYDLLKRWRDKGKAIYVGNKTIDLEKFNDWRNWIVSVLIEESNTQMKTFPHLGKLSVQQQKFPWVNRTLKEKVNHSDYAFFARANALKQRKDKNKIKEWEVENGKKITEIEAPKMVRAWVYLGTRIEYSTTHTNQCTVYNKPVPGKGKAAFNMGHKLAAVNYVIEGSEPYCKEQLDKKQNLPKYKNNIPVFESKKTEYKNRYDKYILRGYEVYIAGGKAANRGFMIDPGNYKIQWALINQCDGRNAIERFPELPERKKPKA